MLIKWAGVQRAAPFVLVIGIAQTVVIPDHFTALFHSKGFILQVGPETPDIHLMGIDGSLPVQNPFSHQHAHTPAAGNAVVGSASCDIKSFQAGNRPHGVIAVRGECIGTVDKLDGFGLIQDGNP